MVEKRRQNQKRKNGIHVSEVGIATTEAEIKGKKKEGRNSQRKGDGENSWFEKQNEEWRSLMGWGVKDTENTRDGEKFNKSCYTLKIYSFPLTLFPEMPVMF